MVEKLRILLQQKEAAYDAYIDYMDSPEHNFKQEEKLCQKWEECERKYEAQVKVMFPELLNVLESALRLIGYSGDVAGYGKLVEELEASVQPLME